MEKKSKKRTNKLSINIILMFVPKYRRKVFYREKRKAVGKILRELCKWKGIKLVEAEV